MTAFPKDMHDSDWAAYFQRQAASPELGQEWLDALGVRNGQRVFDVGSGPGFVSLLAAERVGPTGWVHAVDREAEALAELARQQESRGIDWITRQVADATTATFPAGPFDAVIIGRMLHHADDPEQLIRNVATSQRGPCRILIAEFHPDAPAEFGPDRPNRIAPETVRAWCEAAGLRPVEYARQEPEYYWLLAERQPS